MAILQKSMQHDKKAGKKKKMNENLYWQNYFSHRQIKEKSFEMLRVADFWIN